MTWKSGFAVSILVLALGSRGDRLLAQDTPSEPPPPPPQAEPTTPPPPPPEEEPTAAPPPAAEESSKTGFWGDHFALYIEAGVGSGSYEQIESSIETQAGKQQAVTRVDFDSVNARIAVGWKLPLDHGSFRVVFNGHSEDTYEMQSSGLNRAIIGTTVQPDAPLQWWSVSVHDGTLTGVLDPPTWIDADHDGFVDDGEIQYIPGSGPPPSVRPVADNALNRLQTWDFLYMRDFGGKTWSGDYSCGLRRLLYDGNVPAAAWLDVSNSTNPAGGFTDGTIVHLLSLNQETRGTGPTGSLGLQWHLFRNRLTFFGEMRFAFLLQDMTTDSGDFFTLVTDTAAEPDFTLTVPARLESKVSKSTWNFGGSVGARVRVLPGFHVDLAFERTAYQDTVLLPFSITIPSNPQTAQFGTVALYQTQDLDVDTVRLSLAFQF